MTQKHRYLIIIPLLILMSYCREEEIKFDPTGSRYFPLHIGNYWRLIPENSLGYAIDITVVDEVVIHGLNYFKIHQYVYASGPDPAYEQYVYFRIDADNVAYHLTDSTANIAVDFLSLGAPNGYHWKMSGTNVDVHVVVKDDEINDHVLVNCKSFYYDDPSSYDEESSATFASDIGYIRINSGFGRIARLSVARISGIEYHFDN